MADDEPAAANPKPATIKTIARALSLSPSTVSRGLQGDSSVTAKTRARILEAADRLDYRRDLRGVNLRTGKTFTLCAILASNPSQEFGDPAAMHLIQGLIAGVEGTDFKIVMRPVEGAERRLEAVREAVVNSRFDGVILDHTEPQDAAILYLLERRTPFVTFGRTELFTEHPYFDIDNEQAAFVATRHLIEHGHERIALIGPPGHFLFSRQRLRGYHRALEQANLMFADELVVQSPIGARWVRETTGRLLALPQRPTGFVTSNEVATMGAIAACRALPAKEFARTAFVSRDGTNFFDYYEPPVSSCFYPLLDAGQALATALVQAVEGAPVTALQRVEQAEFIGRPHRTIGETI
jgi:LacI family transcriptional regulator